jgi:GNAT superfamily N-acetyltransferase
LLFAVEAIECAEVDEGELPELQEFLEANPEYYLAVDGSPPGPNEAREQFEFALPPQWPFEKKWLLVFRRKDGCIVGMAGLISNLFAEGVWHIGIFMVATSLHGSGLAQALYDRMESWMRTRGGRWLRLGVVEGNRRAERFWESMGYVDVRRRLDVEMGERVNNRA